MKGTRALSILLALALLASLVIPGSFAMPAKAEDADNGLHISKTAEYNADDDTYTITLEAYATGAGMIIEEYKDIPTDIILVLDRSGSMSDPIGTVKFNPYRNLTNEGYYAVRHNGGSSNLWYMLEDGSYVSVSVSKQEVVKYYELDDLVNYEVSDYYPWDLTDNCYYKYKANLYEKVGGDSYQQVQLNETQSGEWWNPTYTYTYTFLNGDKEESIGRNTKPKLGSHAPLYYQGVDDTQTVYTYTYTNASGETVTIGTSTGADTRFNEQLYQRVVDSNAGGSRMTALKNAAENFVTSVANKATGEDKTDTSDDVKHRLAVVSYASGSTNHTGGLLDMTVSGNATTAKNAINGLTANGGTLIDSGISTANTIFENNPIPANDTSGRQRVLIVFTDGAPGSSGDWDSDCRTTANNAVSFANTAKTTYGATVYTIGIFPGADASNPGSLPEYSTSYLNTTKRTANSNRFMHLLSSNYPKATSMTDTGALNPNLRGDSYYLSASDADTLNSIFQKIANKIEDSGSSTTLGTSAVVRDFISPQFQLPEGATASSITLETYKYTGVGDDPWSKNETALGASASIDPATKQVSVTGFDFSANWCGAVTENGTVKEYRGNKLVISFTVVPKKGFLGGNDVPTNGDASGIYADASASSPIEAFDVPTVNVPIVTPEFTVNNKTIYEGNSTAASGLYTLPDYTGDNAWKAAYVNITTTNISTGETVSPTDCTDYTVTVTYAPKTDGLTSQASGGGTANATTGVSANDTATVHVLHPVVTAAVNDVEKYYGESYTLGDGAGGSITLNWADGHAEHTGVPTAEGTAPYTKDDLHLEYVTTQFAGQSGTVPKSNFDVTVTVKKGSDEVTGATITTTCDISGSNCTTPATDGVYTVHVKTCTLTITKYGGASDEPYVFTVKKDGAEYTEASITGNGSVIIYELPVGTYTIEEDTGWSWRYSGDNGSAAVLNANNPSGSITCTNSISKEYWLNGFSAVVKNVFGVKH